MLKKIHFWVIGFVLLGILVTPAVFSNINKFCYAFKTGIPVRTTPVPLYGFFRINSPNPDFQNFTFAFDFQPGYVASKTFNNFDHPDIYSAPVPGFINPNLYPPLLYYLYNKTISKLPFPEAAMLHLGLQILLLILATFWVFRYYGLSVLTLPAAILYFVAIFLTPVGLSWVERGQFDLYMAIAILFFMLALIEQRSWMFIAAAFFAALKGTLIPFVVVGFLVYLSFHWSLKKLKHFFIFMAVVLLTLMIFPNCWFSCLVANYKYQLVNVGWVTVIDKIPGPWLISMIAINVALYVTSLWLSPRKDAFVRSCLPYMTGFGVLSLMLASLNYEYRAVLLLGFVPMAIVWSIRNAHDRRYQIEFISFFSVFLFIAFHGYWIINPAMPTVEAIIAAYLAYYIAVSVISISSNLSKDPV